LLLGSAPLRSVDRRVHLLGRLRLGLARDALAKGVLVVLAGPVRGCEGSRVGGTLSPALSRGVRVVLLVLLREPRDALAESVRLVRVGAVELLERVRAHLLALGCALGG